MFWRSKRQLHKLAPHLQAGYHAEYLACHYLCRHGLQLIIKNYRCHYGEIDLIMRDEQCLVFVEVRYRKNRYYGDAVNSVNAHKQRKIIATAKHYLGQQVLFDKLCYRYDIVTLHGQQQQELKWHKNAFND